jgi:hypothetical protein
VRVAPNVSAYPQVGKAVPHRRGRRASTGGTDEADRQLTQAQHLREGARPAKQVTDAGLGAPPAATDQVAPLRHEAPRAVIVLPRMPGASLKCKSVHF